MLHTISKQNLDYTCMHNPTFHTSKMLGNFSVSEYCGNNIQFRNKQNGEIVFVEPIKMMQTSADFLLTQETIDELLHAPKYLVSSIQQVSKYKPKKQEICPNDDFIANELGKDIPIDYYEAEDNGDDTYTEFYEKSNLDFINKGVFFLVSMINGKPQMFALNVLTPGQTGKSASLMYLPNGTMDNAIMLERVCYHGENGNEHLNINGELVERDDLHFHIASQDYFEQILDDTKLTYTEKVNKLNSPHAHIVKRHVRPDDANISAIVNMAIKEMHIEGIIPQLDIDDNCDIGERVYHAIEHAHSLSMV